MIVVVATLTAHPRSRGENTGLDIDRMWATGSSPLTRGKRKKRSKRPLTLWLIPAHAGKTRAPGQGGRILLGSSPLTRGKRYGDSVWEVALRLIPAHAGKTFGLFPLPMTQAAHPRSRGENFRSRLVCCVFSGSSPLTRGKLQVKLCLPLYQRFIPAHAGKTPGIGLVGLRHGAHPRSRGENCRASWSTSSLRGSSPLTRGKLEIPVQLVVSYGLIPAHAGKTSA